MALKLLFSDDFASYSSQAEFEAAYPLDPPSDMSTSVINTAWSLTNGPDGEPGVNPTSFAGFFHKRGLNPCTTDGLFRVTGSFDFTATPESLLTMHWHQAGTGWPGTRSDNIFEVSRNGTLPNPTITFRVRTINSGMFDPDNWHAFVSGAITPGVTAVLRVEGKVSTILETSPGVYSPDTDGWAKLYIDDVEQASFTGPVWNGSAGQSGATPYWNAVQVAPTGHFSNFEIWDNDTCGDPSTEIVDNSDICCSAGDGGNTVPSGGGQGAGAQPVQYPLIGAQIECAGGGLVPTQASLTHAENWWGA
jgi:hypothetical protein